MEGIINHVNTFLLLQRWRERSYNYADFQKHVPGDRYNTMNLSIKSLLLRVCPALRWWSVWNVCSMASRARTLKGVFIL